MIVFLYEEKVKDFERIAKYLAFRQELKAAL
jgi:hypothetical protein